MAGWRGIRRLIARLRGERHVHVWLYEPKLITGWGVVRCRDCGREDLW